jgi:hypothetical protein
MSTMKDKLTASVERYATERSITLADHEETAVSKETHHVWLDTIEFVCRRSLVTAYTVGFRSTDWDDGLWVTDIPWGAEAAAKLRIEADSPLLDPAYSSFNPTQSFLGKEEAVAYALHLAKAHSIPWLNRPMDESAHANHRGGSMMTWHWPSAAQLADIIKTAETSTLDEVLSVVTKSIADEMDSTRNHIARLEKEVTDLRDQIAELREKAR